MTGLPLFTPISLTNNKLARILNGVKLSDKLKSSVLVGNLNFLSVNQLNAQTKLLEKWKALYIAGNPLKVEQVIRTAETAFTRSSKNGTCFSRSLVLRVWVKEHFWMMQDMSGIMPLTASKNATAFILSKRLSNYLLKLYH